MCLGGVSLFWKFFIALNKTDNSQTHFGFTNLGPEMLIFSVIAKRNFKFWFGSPDDIVWWTYVLGNDAVLKLAVLILPATSKRNNLNVSEALL